MPTETNQPGPPSAASDDAKPAEGHATDNSADHPKPNRSEPRPERVSAKTVGPQSKPPAGPAPVRDRSMAWMILLALLAVTAIPIYTYLGTYNAPNDEHERTLQITAESWRHRHMMYQGDVTLESIVPVSDSRAQLNTPPGIVWLNQLALTSLDPLTATDGQIAYQMRLVSAMFALLTIAAVFWAGFSVGGLKTASFSALTILACPVLILFARAGSPQMPLVGMQTLAVASAMWALRPLRTTPSLPRQAIGWIICGIALGMAVLTGSFVVAPLILLPILVISIMCPNRVSHLLGLVASVFIAALMVMPWALYVHEQDTQIWQQWIGSLWPEIMASPSTFGRALSDRGLLVLIMVLPWTLWLIGSSAQPFSASSSGVRRRVFIGWAWLLSVMLLVITGPGRDGLDGLLPILPAAAILIGQCLRLFSDLSAEARHARTWRITRWPHLAMLLVVSIALPAGMYFQNALIERGIFNQPVVAPMAWYFWLGLSACLLLITALSTRFALRHYPGKAMVCWSLWSIVFMSVMLIPLSRGPLMKKTISDATTPAPSNLLPGVQ